MERAQAKAFALFSMATAPFLPCAIGGSLCDFPPPSAAWVAAALIRKGDLLPFFFFFPPSGFQCVCVHVTLCARQVMTNSRDHRLHQSGCRLVQLLPALYQYFFSTSDLTFSNTFRGRKFGWVCCCCFDMGLTLGFNCSWVFWWRRVALVWNIWNLKKNENFWRFISNVNDEWSGLIIGKWRPLLLGSAWCLCVA